MSGRQIAFAGVTLATVAVIAAVFISSAGEAGDSGPAPTALAAIKAGDLLAIGLDANRAQDVGRVVVLPGGRVTGARRVTALKCKRVAYAGGSGICIAERRRFPTRAYTARFFDERQRVRGSVSVNGFPSRTRVSPGGRLAASTTFVHGDSYATAGQFSTRTAIFDARRAKRLADLEDFTITKDGKRIKSVDFNFWGVTFDGDDGAFYATLGTGDHHYLVRGRRRLAHRRGRARRRRVPVAVARRQRGWRSRRASGIRSSGACTSWIWRRRRRPSSRSRTPSTTRPSGWTRTRSPTTTIRS